MTAKRFNVEKVVDLKFAALPNKELRSLRGWPTFHEKMFLLDSFGTYILSLLFYFIFYS